MPVARVSRREAIQVAAVKRARDLVAGSLGTLPLITVKPDLSIDRTSWLAQPEADVPPSVTMTRTIEDLLYEGIAWWFITGFAWDNYPARVVRLDPRSVDVQKDGRVRVTLDGNRGHADEWPQDSQLIRFDSPNDPLLVAGARAIRQCLLLDAAALRHASGSPPLDYFTPTDGVDPDSLDFLDDWQAARQTRSTGYVPAAVTYNVAGWNPEQLQMAEARNHAVLEIARVAGVDPEELGVSTTSRTYANQFDRRKAFLDFTLGGYRAAIEGRLSMGDVTPRGTKVRFDLDDFLRSDAKSRYEAYKVGLEVGAVTPDRIAEAEGVPAKVMTPGTPAAPALRSVPEPVEVPA
ncbi:phage portal protein [Nocardioides marinquilinus]|uniref:phage portal protein n=1 Tax=Nocardioides marinquilinus TaxID=1210400 RepID=UPI0031EFA232